MRLRSKGRSSTSSDRPIAALTGATGFLGVHLVRALDRAGFTVRALVRRGPSPPGWGDAKPKLVAGDLADAAALAALVEGAVVVVHCAGAIKGDLDQLRRVNVDGTIAVAEAAARMGAELVLVSSLAARQPEVSAYAASKRAAEAAAASVEPARLTVVRPPAIYGPGDRETLALFQAAVASPVLPVLDDSARLALIHVADAAEQLAALAGAPTHALHALADANPAGYGWREIAAAASRAVGKRRFAAPLSPALLPPLIRAAGFLSRMNGRPPPISADKLGELLHPDWAVRPEELAPNRPQPRFDLDSGFANAVAWYREAGWLR